MLSTLMSEKDIQTRKRWLTLLSLTTLIHPLNFFLRFPLDQFFELSAWSSRTESLLTVGFFLAINYLVYHCAYKNPGTKLLTFYILLARVTFVLAVYNWVREGTLLNTDTLYMRICFLLDNGLYLYWYLLNLKMRTINYWRYINTTLYGRIPNQVSS